MSNLKTIVGRVSHVGSSTRNEHDHTYSAVEIQTPDGRIDLKEVTAVNDVHRALKPQKDVALVVLHIDKGAKSKSIVLGAYDKGDQRLYANEEMYKLRDHATKSALLLSLSGIVVIPIGLAFFVVPGLLYIQVLWKSWTSIKFFPPGEEIRQAVERLPTGA